MENVLQLCESINSNYPDHFLEFLNNSLEKFSNIFSANDYLFAAVYFIILESGFYPQDLYDNFAYSFTESFDIRKLRSVKSYSNEHVKSMENHFSKHWIYGISLRLGKYRCKCELQGVPSAENNNYLIINFLLNDLGVVKSLCLNTENYIERNYDSSKHCFRLKNLEDLTLLIKNKLSNAIKENILLCEAQGCCPHLLRLPEDIQIRIINFLTGNSVDVQYLASTCSYFYNMIANDNKLWGKLFLSEYDLSLLKTALLDVPEEILKKNLFRTAYFKLKKDKTSTRASYNYSDSNVFLLDYELTPFHPNFFDYSNALLSHQY